MDEEMPVDVHNAAQLVVTVDFDAEELWLAEDPENARRPGVLSQARYGVQVAVPALLAMFRELDVPATFFVCGGDAERHPHAVDAIAAGGFEIGHHGFSHRSPHTMTAEQEEAEIVDGLTALHRHTDRVAGYRSPSWDFGSSTLGLLQRHGFAYSSNMMDAVHPYRHAEHDLVELPVHWLLDDAPHFWFDTSSWDKTIRSAGEVAAIWREEAAAIWDLGGLVTLTMHPQIIGRPSRLRMLREFLTWARGRSGLALSTAGDLAASLR
ncbi:polysaccharide deacetylase [Actinoplanes sp. NPDC051851]|uniref:polysaccharide deacetylase family protein n=1 Tax=Actinoplanes sp. NPDC051851 TaxID=3154753 RepID=UPI00342FDCCD